MTLRSKMVTLYHSSPRLSNLSRGQPSFLNWTIRMPTTWCGYAKETRGRRLSNLPVDTEYEYLVMLFGLTNVPIVFQVLVNDVLRDMLNRICLPQRHPGSLSFCPGTRSPCLTGSSVPPVKSVVCKSVNSNAPLFPFWDASSLNGMFRWIRKR